MLSDLEAGDPARLIEAIARHRDREAFATLFSSYAPRVKGFLMRAGTPADVAEEIAQETMLSVWRKAELFDASRAGASTWIFAIARNLRIDRLRRDRVVGAGLFEVLEADDAPPPDETLNAHERDERVRAALRDLSSEQVAVVRLSFFEDKPHGEIAQLLGLPLGTVKSRLRLAMTKLRRRLEDLS